MKIAFVSIIKETWGGSEELWAAAANELLEEGQSVVISALSPLADSSKIQNLQKKKAKLIIRRGYIQPGLTAQKRIPKKILLFLINKLSNPYKKLFHENADVLVYTGACDSLKHDPYFLKLLYKSNKALIIINQVHSEYQKTFDDHEAEVLKKVFHYSSKNLFVSQRNKEVMERFLADDIPNAEVIRNPVNLNEIGPIEFPPLEKIQFAIVANLLINHKGHDILFEILSKKPWIDRNWHLNIYGSGVDEKYLNRLAAFYKISHKLTFHGKVQDIRNVWKHNHILLMPSRLEGMPLAIVEAMLCGRPVVTTDVAGHTEWIREGVEGFIAGGANVISFAKAMESAWQEKDRWQTLGRNAYEQALKLYDPSPGKTLGEIILKVVRDKGLKEVT